ncbi:MAG: hypothetical protein LBP70_02355 [Mycoplasmataceae bacterium]|jgi:hypothetical protein|nr:hypothetical protein [Mycoplasmataceae bacterium]
MAKYKITKYPSDPQLENTEFEVVIIKNMILFNLVKKIATDVGNIKTHLKKHDRRLDKFVKANKLKEQTN